MTTNSTADHALPSQREERIGFLNRLRTEHGRIINGTCDVSHKLCLQSGSLECDGERNYTILRM